MAESEKKSAAAFLRDAQRRFRRARASTGLPSGARSRFSSWLPYKREDGVALAYQDAILQGVSRTFALTIPCLPKPLADVVANAYLLCRIADTIEDEPALAPERKQAFQIRFQDAVAGRLPAEAFACALTAELSEGTPETERELVRNTPTVLRITRRFTAAQRGAIERCVDTMCRGMHAFEARADANGLADAAALDEYCYYVAGIVGEMLTELFCDHSPAIAVHRDAMMKLAVSFGQGLQMTNIIKDVWDDRARGVCWYPRAVFERHGFDLSTLSERCHGPGFEAGVRDLVAIAHGHLRDALAYILLIPARESGIRLFCAWAVGMAVLTLDKVNAHPGFTHGDQVKISRRAVQSTIFTTRITVRSDIALTALFNRAAGRLPVPARPQVPLPEAGRTAGCTPRV